MSWRAEYADDSGRWTTNGLRFATKQEAEDYVSELAIRWTAVRETRAVECDDPVNYTYHDHQLRPVEGITVRAMRMLDHDENQLELPFGRVIGRRLAVKRDKRWSPGPSGSGIPGSMRASTACLICGSASSLPMRAGASLVMRSFAQLSCPDETG